MCGCCYVNKTTDNFIHPSSTGILEENATFQNINVTSDELSSSSTNFDIIVPNDFNIASDNLYSTISNDFDAITSDAFNDSSTTTLGAFNNSDTIAPDVFNNSVTIANDASNIGTDNFGNIVFDDLSAIIPDSDSISYNESEYDVQDNNDSDVMIYDLDKVHEIIANKFEEFEIFNDSVKFIFKVKLDQDLLTELLLDQDTQLQQGT
ncbi:18688_t:CDS:2 [Racocetra fulgida]|uniref:18688_t:CDS:1 n=1 Tax=Racocetra fulgida TaxID=60492 RepID=A0A9N9G514_9GLOM|nr:18688_t:CDS:2 [Racocetra fulgida]